MLFKDTSSESDCIKISLNCINHQQSSFVTQGGPDNRIIWYFLKEFELLMLISNISEENPISSYVQDKFENLCRKKVDYGYDYNKIIQQKKAFRNPSIYEKLILFCDIDEFGMGTLGWDGWRIENLINYFRYKLSSRALRWPPVWERVLLRRVGEESEGGDGQEGEVVGGEEEVRRQQTEGRTQCRQ